MSTFDPKVPPTAAAFTSVSIAGFTCDMTGYTGLVQQITEFIFFAVSLLKEIVELFAPENLKLSLMYFYNGMLGTNSWIGYLVATVYFFGLDYGYADTMCKVSSYLYSFMLVLNSGTDFAHAGQAHLS